MRDHATVLVIYGVLLALIAVAAYMSPVFRSPANAANVLRQSAVPGVVAVGQTLVILTGGIDLSVGSVVKLTTVLTAGIMQGNPDRMPSTIALMLGMGALVGLVNGLLVAKARVAPFVVTLGTFSIVRGLALAYTTTPVGSVARPMRAWYRSDLGFLPWPFVVFLLLLIAGVFVLRRTAFGRAIYAVGGDERVARLAGIRADRVKVAVYVVSGLLAAAAGLITVARMGVGDPVVGDGFELDAITAVVLGGTSLYGGRGGLAGTLAGVLLLSLTGNVMNLLRVSVWYQQLIKGLIILGAVAIYKQRRGR